MPNDGPLVSVIVPNYNYGASLELCLRAIQEQTYQPLEIVLVDDCSTDDSVAVAQRLGIEAVSTGVNGGVAVARNLGAEVATGEVLVFVDSDVALAPEAVANAVQVLRDDPSLGAVCGVYEPHPLIRDSLVEEYRSLQQYYLLIESEGPLSTVHTSHFTTPAAVFHELGGFNPQLRHTEDQDFGLRLVRRYGSVSVTGVRGTHDHDDTLATVLRKAYARTRLAIPLYLKRRSMPGGFVTGPRTFATVLSLATVAAAALPAFIGGVWALAPLLLLAAALGCDAGLYRCAARHKGWSFLPYFAAINFLVNLTVAAGIITGGVRCLFSRSFRELYSTALAPAPRVSAR